MSAECCWSTESTDSFIDVFLDKLIQTIVDLSLDPLTIPGGEKGIPGFTVKWDDSTFTGLKTITRFDLPVLKT